MEQLIAVARSLRIDHRFGGYIHLKAAPGVSPELLEEAGRYADRLSVNVELPTERDLARLAPEKNMGEVESVMREVGVRIAAARADKSTKTPAYAPAGQSTQMIIGATPSTDAEVLATSTRLYRTHGLRRVYYSAFSPIPHADRRLPTEAPPLVREHRLYEADWLVRFYGFDASELTTPSSPNLDLALDPKLAWALSNRSFFPVDVNVAPREALLRVPGFGVRSVDRIVRMRRHHAVRAEDLLRLRLPLRRALPFIVTEGGVRPAASTLDRLDLSVRVQPAKQLALFEARVQSATGQL
jgi:predicted DNA-binding helix-hairpin-helix protein